MGEDWYRTQGIEVCDSDRGGRVTYHGPGQLVGYPIMRVERVADYVQHDGAARSSPRSPTRASTPRCATGLTGVWAGDRKIGSIGVHVSRGVTTHGFAINVDNDLQPFEYVVPCGIEGVRMTSRLEGDRPRRDRCRASASGWRSASPRRSGSGSGWSRSAAAGEAERPLESVPA